jgi:SpoVK/Ycf46/Vps4 family AAA+-type ATPase
MLELLNQLDGFEPTQNIKVRPWGGARCAWGGGGGGRPRVALPARSSESYSVPLLFVHPVVTAGGDGDQPHRHPGPRPAAVSHRVCSSGVADSAARQDGGLLAASAHTTLTCCYRLFRRFRARSPSLPHPPARSPGRIDRKIEFPHPNEESREQILRIHSRKMNLTRGIDLRKIATMLPSANGAECKAVCTEAGMFALRERRMHVTQVRGGDTGAGRRVAACGQHDHSTQLTVTLHVGSSRPPARRRTWRWRSPRS